MEEIIEQAKQYQIDAAYAGRAHYKSVDLDNRWNNFIGVPVVITTTIVATSIFATLNSNPEIKWRILTGMISILAAVLSALQTFFRFSDRAEKHRVCGAKYGALRRKIEQFVLKYKGAPDDKRSEALKEMENISQSLSQLAEDSISISQKAYDLAIKELETEAGKVPTSVGRIHDSK